MYFINFCSLLEGLVVMVEQIQASVTVVQVRDRLQIKATGLEDILILISEKGILYFLNFVEESLTTFLFSIEFTLEFNMNLAFEFSRIDTV